MIYYWVWFFVIIIYSPVFFQLYSYGWEKIDYTHAYYILPISLWVVWQKRQKLKEFFLNNQPRGTDYLGLTAAMLGMLMFVFGWRQGYVFFTALSLIPVVWGISRFLYGGAVTKSLRFPILYLLFLIPPPLGLLDLVTVPMRYGISALTASILDVLNYPIQRNGLMLTIGGNEVFMGAPCSGFRSLITMLALAVAYVYFVKGDVRKKIILIGAVIPFALLGNLIRVLALCLVNFYAGREAADGFFHYFSGGVIFVVMICCLMGLEYILDRQSRKVSIV